MKLLDNSLSLYKVRTAEAAVFSSIESINNPFQPSLTISGIPPTFVETNGFLLNMYSATANPNPSHLVSKTAISNLFIKSYTLSTHPVIRKRFPKFNSKIKLSTFSLSSPSPTHYKKSIRDCIYQQMSHPDKDIR